MPQIRAGCRPWFVASVGWISLILTTIGGGGATGQAAPPVRECDHPPAGAIVCEDFEAPDPRARFNDYDGALDVDFIQAAGPAGASSNTLARLRAPAGERGGADLIKYLPQSHDRLWARWYLQYEPGFDFDAPNHGGGLAAGAHDLLGRSGIRPAGDDYAGFFVEYSRESRLLYAYSYYRGMYQDCADPNGSCWGDSLPCVYDDGSNYCTKPQHRPTTPPPTAEAGRWICVEQMVDMGTPTASEANADGRFSLWVDGQRVTALDDLWLRTSTSLELQILYLSLFHHDGTHSRVGELIDNVVVATQPIGCGEPIVSPAAPTALRIE